MNIIIVCHTEFGFVSNKMVIFDKNYTGGVKEGVSNLINIAEKYGAKITFAVCPEVANFFPKNVKHEIGLHIHPGWGSWNYKKFTWNVGDSLLRDNVQQLTNSTAMMDHTYEKQLEMIKFGKNYLSNIFGIEPKSYVSGRWSVNNDTVKALIKNGFTNDCSAPAHSKSDHYDWSKLPRICMPYNPSEEDYQERGNLPLLIIPISQMLRLGNVNPEVTNIVGIQLLKACFTEYYNQNLPLFHICLHSPCMTNQYFIEKMDNLLNFIAKHKNIEFRFASQITKTENISPKTEVWPYFFGINKSVIKLFFEKKIFRK